VRGVGTGPAAAAVVRPGRIARTLAIIAVPRTT
jgi:hypothetical protein